MITADKIERAKSSADARESLIKEYSNFICSCASKAAGRFVDKSDDIYSEALIAFDNALTSYDRSKGNFNSFAKIVIHNRINDYLKKQNRHCNVVPFGSLAVQNDNGEYVDFDPEDKNAEISDTAIEIFSLKQELKIFDIDFFDLPSASPKSAKTRKACIEIVKYITGNQSLLDSFYKSKTLPVKAILSDLNVNKKIPERHRKYIIMGVLITEGKYEVLLSYLDPEKGRCK